MKKSDFPALMHQKVSYLDSAASTHKPQAVLKAWEQHQGITAKQVRMKARQAISKLTGCEPDEVVFTPQGTTYAINWIAQEFGPTFLKNGDNIVVSGFEHHSNLVPWQVLAQQQQAELKVWPATQNFELDQAQQPLDKKTKLLILPLYSNVIGPMWEPSFSDLKLIIDQAHAYGAKVLLDAAQAVGHAKINFAQLGADLIYFSAHKIMGPTNLGVVISKQALLTAISRPALPVDLPNYPLKPTPNQELVELRAAVELLETLDFTKEQKKTAALCTEVLDFLQQFDWIKILGTPKKLRTHGCMVSFVPSKIHAHDLATFLGQHKICARAGHHCAQPLHQAVGMPLSVRLSFFVYNDADDIKKFKDAFLQAVKFFETEQ